MVALVKRLPIVVRSEIGDSGDGGCRMVVDAEAYYAHRSFADDMWIRSGKIGFESYNHDVAKGYVKRDLRPKD
ncbi:hypothetical protein QVD17_27013 [Tagetes erecta]|uniref:Uncharacterized protein n=1 Tax=Tagetes erecta TaxID=13708 RepID=A0AAD8K7Q3_TARER|nr:hypothetical protein QVD17_27013 [Tagetes erecta]